MSAQILWKTFQNANNFKTDDENDGNVQNFIDIFRDDSDNHEKDNKNSLMVIGNKYMAHFKK